MNKRGDTTVWEEIVKAIPAMMIVLLLIWAGVKIWNSVHPEQFTTEKKDLKRIVAEIKDLKNNDDIDIPIFMTSNYGTELVKMDKDKKSVYPGCSKDYCVCFKKDKVPFVCETFNIDMKIFNYDQYTCDKIEVKSEETEVKQIKITRKGIGTCYIGFISPTPKPPNSQNTDPAGYDPNSVSGSSTDPNIATATGGP